MSTIVPGRCLCGAVRFAVTLPAVFCIHCHCTMCRRNHGAGFVTWFGVPPDRLRIVSGADRLVSFASSDHGTRRFCGRCGSSMLCASSRHPEWVDVALGAMEGEIGLAPQAHVYFADRVSWVPVTDALPRLAAGPDEVNPRT